MHPPPPQQGATLGTSTKNLKAAHQGTLIILAAASPRDTTLAAFLAIFTLLDPRAGTPPRYRIQRLATLPLEERPLLVVCVDTLNLHIRVLWGAKYVIPSFIQITPKYSKFLVFPWDVSQGQVPNTLEVNPNWLQVDA